MTYDIGNPDHGFGWARKCGGIMRANVNLNLLIIGSPTSIRTIKHRNAQKHFHTKRPHAITKKNKNINIDNTITMNVHRFGFVYGV
jgi:hypothetical protein